MEKDRRLAALNAKAGEQPKSGKASPEFLKQLAGWGLTTAEILYHLPDHPSLLQTYLWQEYDLAPHFPSLRRFLDFWRDKLEGPLHSVRVAHGRLIKPSEINMFGSELQLH